MDYKEKVITMLNSKELSQEQKEKLENIFPEFKENEDERIRKKLICFVENWKKFNPNSPFDDYAVYTSDSGECDKILAWLEKQGEHLDPDKVIEWLEDQACLGWIEDIEVDKFIKKFKKDFEI